MGEFLKNLAVAVFQVIFVSAIFLFTLRQYLINRRFTLWLNQQFTKTVKYLKKWEEWITTEETRRVGFGVVMFILCFLALLFQWGWFLPVFIAWSIYIGLPWLGEINRRSTYTDLNKVVEMINNGHISDREIEGLKTVISAYYRRKYRPKEISFGEASRTGKIIMGVIKFLIVVSHPRLWARVILPTLTKIPPFDLFWRSSPYHARYDAYSAIIEYIQQAVDVPGIDLTVDTVEIHPPMLLVYFKPKDKHQKARAGKLAQLIEGELSMDPKTIVVQSREDKLLLLIPMKEE